MFFKISIRYSLHNISFSPNYSWHMNCCGFWYKQRSNWSYKYAYFLCFCLGPFIEKCVKFFQHIHWYLLLTFRQHLKHPCRWSVEKLFLLSLILKKNYKMNTKNVKNKVYFVIFLCMFKKCNWKNFISFPFCLRNKYRSV